MPEKLKDGENVDVRLFLKNISDQDIFLTVSNRGGYDYAMVTDTKGNTLNVDRPYVYPTFFSGGLIPEVNPGQTTCHPPLATLTKLCLQPGAVFELQTRTSLSYQAEKNPSKRRGIGFEDVGTVEKSAKSIINATPTEALVTWRLHTTNGAEHSKDLKSRLWPARGGWTGILETAPLKVALLGDKNGQ
jgi:hypothetical protein